MLRFEEDKEDPFAGDGSQEEKKDRLGQKGNLSRRNSSFSNASMEYVNWSMLGAIPKPGEKPRPSVFVKKRESNPEVIA